VTDNEKYNTTRLVWERLGEKVYCMQLAINGRQFLVMNRQILGVKRRRPLLFFSLNRTDVRRDAT